MRVLWTEPALAKWEESLDYIEAESASAVKRIEARVLDAIGMLAAHPYAGRVGRITVTRQFAVPRSPFIIVYEVDENQGEVWIDAVFDGRRRWPKAFPKE